MDDQLLRTSTTDVLDFGPTVDDLVSDLRDTMSAHAVCVGLAAPQIGSSLRVAVAQVADGETVVLINPVVLATSGKKDVKRESCMSLWGLTGSVERREKVLVAYLDERGSPQERQFKSFAARVIQHEIDHLDGTLYDTRAQGGLVRTDLFDAESAP